MRNMMNLFFCKDTRRPYKKKEEMREKDNIVQISQSRDKFELSSSSIL